MDDWAAPRAEQTANCELLSEHPMAILDYGYINVELIEVYYKGIEETEDHQRILKWLK